MKNLRITSSCLFNGHHVEAGTVLTQLAEKDASDLLAAGCAVEVVEHRDPEIQHRDPKPAKAAKKSA